MAWCCMHCLSCFKEKRTRDRHTKEKHENIVLLKCEQCEYQCDRKDNMDRHVKSKHNGSKYKCFTCRYSSTRKDNFNRHTKAITCHL